MAARTPQQVAESYLHDVLEVLRATHESDGAGGTVSTYKAVGAVPCRRSTPNTTVMTRESVIADKVDGRAVYQFRVPLDADVRLDDRVRCRGCLCDVISAPQDGYTLKTFLGAEVR